MTRLFVLLLACVLVPLAAAEDKLLFNRDVRPILSENCYKCHGPDKGNRKKKLRLDQRESAVAKVIVPNKPDESEFIKRIVSTDPDELMPPPESHKQLTQAQKDILKRWIADGAEYQPHWSYITPIRAPVPAVKAQASVANPIDAFIVHAMEAKNIQPSKEADKRMLLRRLSLDLVGLPPTPEEVAAFVADTDAKAYEHAVDRLMASPHFGERMAVPWLDAVRFADTVGYHGDQNVNVFPYRDYVIDSFNKNKPFDRFTIEQLAGDLLPNPTEEQRIATGYNRLNMVTREGGAQPKEYLAKYEADRVRTIAGTWLGSTMGCCECHDHKFDPFTAKDFYSMEAFFADVKQWGVYSDYKYTPNPDLRGFTNDFPFPPEIEVDSPHLKERMDELHGRIAEIVKSSGAKLDATGETAAAYAKWRAGMGEFMKTSPTGWAAPECTVAINGAVKSEKGKRKEEKAKKIEQSKPTSVSARSGDKATAAPQQSDEKEPVADPRYTINSDRSILIVEKSALSLSITLNKLPPQIAAIKLEVLPDAKHNGSILQAGDSSEDVKLSASIHKKDGNKEIPLSFRHADAAFKLPTYSNGFAAIGIKNGWRLQPAHLNEPNIALYLLETTKQTSPGDTLTVKIPDSVLGRVRISVTPLAFLASDQSGEFDKALLSAFANSTETPETRAALREAYLRTTAWEPGAFAELSKQEALMVGCRHGRAMTVVSEAIKPAVIRVLARGNWQDESGEIVTPSPPHFLPQLPNPDNHRLTRLDLAKWLVAPQNPLTSRAIVNRMWKQFFGMGLSAVVDDLGGQGEWPVNPDLLDWLAVEFRESGWDIKHMVKLMVMSSTYRQDSNLRPEMKDIDPNNRLLSSQSPRRLEAEFVRDNALSIAGLLNLDIGGPSAHPYQPRGYYAALQFPNRDYISDMDDRQYRRGMYTHWQRTFLHPMMANFDAPAREECACARNVANTPQQALTLLNDPTFVEAARVFAQNVLGANPAQSDKDRIDSVFQRALARSVKPKELESLTAFLAAQREHYKSGGDDPKKLLAIGNSPASEKLNPVELAAWTELCRVVINLHETITRY